MPTFTPFPRKRTKRLSPKAHHSSPQFGGWGRTGSISITTGLSPLNMQLLTGAKPRGTGSASQVPPNPGGSKRSRAASSPARHRHLHACGRNGRTQLVQVPNARGAGVATVHLERRRGALVPSPHPSCGGLRAARSGAPHRREGVRVEAEKGGGGGEGRGGRRRTSLRIQGPCQSWQSRYCLASAATGCSRPVAAAGRGLIGSAAPGFWL